MKALKVTNTGDLIQEELDRKDLTSKFGIHNRDLRPVFSRKQITSIVRRGQLVIISIRSVKLLVSSNSVFVFNLEKKKIPEYFVPILVEKITLWNEKKEKTRFEHLVLEITLAYILDKMNRRFEDLERVAEQLFHKLKSTKVKDQTFEQLLHLKKRLSKLETVVEEIEKEITEIVEEDEELADLYIQKTPPKNTDEIESILENTLEQIEDTSHRIDELNENIDDTQEILTLKLDNMRNTVIKFDLLLTSITGVLALLAVITGMYGMNLRSGYEEDPQAFLNISLGLVIIFFVAFGLVILWLKRKKVI